MIPTAELHSKNGPAKTSDDGWLSLLRCPNCVGLIESIAEVWRCTACGALYPRVGQSPDFLAGNARPEDIEEDYEKDPRRRSGAMQRVYHELRRGFEVELIRREAERLGRPLDIVDIGSSDPTGSGSYHTRIKPLARTYLGVEPSLPLVQSAIPTAKVGVVRGSGEQTLLGSNTVDVAICFSALDHCRNPDLVLSNIAKALRDGGCAVIELKNARAWYRPLYDYSPRRLQKWVAPAEHAHPWNFSPEFLTRRLLAASFRTVDLHDCLYCAPFLRTRRLNLLSDLIGAQRLERWLSSTDVLGRALAPGRGGTFVALARK